MCGVDPASSSSSTPLAQDAIIDHEPIKIKSASVPGRRRRRMRPLYKVLWIWLGLLLAVFSVAQWVKHGRSSQVVAAGQAGNAESISKLDESQLWLEDVLPQCRETLATFLSSVNTAQRLPLVLPHPQIAQRMERHYADNELAQADPETLVLKASTRLALPEGDGVLTQWQTPEGAVFDAAFRKADQRWVLDWNHFVRYSDLSWPLFVAGSGKDIAEFRLLARPRLASVDDPRNGIGVVLSAPMSNQMREAGFSQSMLGLSTLEKGGLMLEQAFDQQAAGIALFGATFRDINPEGMIRVCVRIQRTGENGGFQFRIQEVLACHWYDSQASGLD